MLIGVLAFLLLLIALLAVPVTLTFQVTWQQAFQSEIKLLWLFGLARIRLPSSQSKIPSPKNDDPTQKTSRIERSPREKTSFNTIIWQKAFRRRIVRFLSDLWHAVHKRDVSLRIRIGLGDPADTGQLWAIIGPVSGILANIQEASIEIEPEFLDTTFELDCSGTIRIIPLQMLYLTARLLLSPALWQGIKQMRAAQA